MTDKSDYTFKGDLVISDVCAECNNGPLSSLDASFLPYFKKQMLDYISQGDDVTFEYDYDLLLRELLKISFNSSRASVSGDSAKSVFEKYIPYILSGKGDVSGVAVSLMIVTSSVAFPQAVNRSPKIVKPYLLRSAKVDGKNINDGKYIVRVVAFNSFWFHLLIPKTLVNSKARKEFWNEFKSKTHLHGVLLKKGFNSLKISKAETTSIHPKLLEKMYRKGK